MDIELLNTVANSQFVYLIMFMCLLLYVMRSTDSRELKSEARETRMREQLDKTIPILSEILSRLDVIEDEIKNKGC